MKSAQLVQNLLVLVFSSRGCNAMAGWPSTTAAVSSLDSKMMYHQQGRPLRSLGFLAHRTRPSTTGNRFRAVAAALAPSTSHLATGRTASGVLESCIEGCLGTLGSFVGGAVTGCVIGGFMGATFGRVPDVGILKSVQVKAVQMGGDWGKLTAAFTGFTSISTVVRGRNDKWDQVVGACGAGAFLSRAQGLRGMAQGAATYGLFSLVFAVQSKEDELDVVDVPVDPPTKKR